MLRWLTLVLAILHTPGFKLIMIHNYDVLAILHTPDFKPILIHNFDVLAILPTPDFKLHYDS